MGFVIPGVKTPPGADGKGGECCPCTENMSACACGATYSIACRYRGGTYVLVGFEEYVSPSVPPKKYRAANYSGSMDFLSSTGIASSCETVVLRGTLTQGGSTIYSKKTGLIVSASGAYSSTGGVVTPADGSVSGSRGKETETACVNGTLTRTLSRASGADCCVEALLVVKHSGSLQTTLSDEDTEADAIARASKTLAWSAWSQSGSCCAYKTQRKAGQFSGGFQEAELKIVANGSPNAEVRVEITFHRRSLDGGPITIGDQQVTLFCDGSGAAEQVISIASEVGFEICYAGSKQI